MSLYHVIEAPSGKKSRLNPMRSIFIISFILFSALKPAVAQTSNGEVSSLVAAENYFASLVKQKGINKGFLAVSDDETIVFKPAPVKAEDFYGSRKNQDTSKLTWQPALAKISKSGDWGFTTGPFIYTRDSVASYGTYVSVWKMNSKGVWKLAIDIGVSHPKPKKELALIYSDPKSSRFFRQKSAVRQKQREEMILTSDQLFSKTLQKYNNLAYNVFMADDARLLFPGQEPIIGKRNITDFLRYQELEINTEVIDADRATGSDLAYTYGTASIAKAGQTDIFNYIRIWEVQDGHKWNVILEVYSPVETEG